MNFDDFSDETRACYEKGESLIASGDTDGAIACFEEAMELQKAKCGEKHESVAATAAELGMCYLVNGKYEKALEIFDKATSIFVEVSGFESENVANCYYLLGTTNMELKKYADASKNFGELLLISTKLFGADAELTENARALYNKAMALDTTSQDAEAERIATLTDARECFTEGTKCFDSGIVYLAIKYFQRAVELKSGEGISIDDDIVEYMRALAIAYTEVDMRSEALDCLLRLRDICIDLYGEFNENVYGTYNMMAYNYLLNDDYDKSIEYMNKTISVSIKLFGDKSSEVVRDYTLLAHVYEMKGDIDKAIASQIIVESLLNATLDESSLIPLARCYNELAKLYNEKHDYAKSLEYTEQELDINKRVYGEVSREVLATYENMAYLYNMQKDETRLNAILDKMGELNDALGTSPEGTDTDTEA